MKGFYARYFYLLKVWAQWAQILNERKTLNNGAQFLEIFTERWEFERRKLWVLDQALHFGAQFIQVEF